MQIRHLFNQWSNQDVIDLITAYPLALVTSRRQSGYMVTPLPMLADTDEAGNIVRLVGHMGLSNPQKAALDESPEAYFLFQGPQGYISPGLVENRKWLPTWNYAIAKIEADIIFKPEENDTALHRIVEAMETGRPDAWSIAEAADRYDGMKQWIIAFHAEVRSVGATFKLGQDETPETLRKVIKGLDNRPLADWMYRFNKDRL